MFCRTRFFADSEFGTVIFLAKIDADRASDQKTSDGQYRRKFRFVQVKVN